VANLLTYTSYAEVRAHLGVSDEELGDETLALGMYYTGLLEDLYVANPLAQETFDTLPIEADRTPLQSRVYRLTRLFASLSVARQLASSMPMFAPRSLSDGKASMSRFVDPYTDVVKRIGEQYDLNLDRLKQALDELLAQTQPSVRRTVILGVGLARDPVTG
jgi:hypothetical protein